MKLLKNALGNFWEERDFILSLDKNIRLKINEVINSASNLSKYFGVVYVLNKNKQEWIQNKNQKDIFKTFVYSLPQTSSLFENLKTFASYLEENGISDRDIYGDQNFPIENYVDFGEHQDLVMNIIRELNNDKFRIKLDLDPLKKSDIIVCDEKQ